MNTIHVPRDTAAIRDASTSNTAITTTTDFETPSLLDLFGLTSPFPDGVPEVALEVVGAVSGGVGDVSDAVGDVSVGDALDAVDDDAVDGVLEVVVSEGVDDVLGVVADVPVVGPVVGFWGVGGRVVFPQQGALKGLNKVSSPSTHTSPAILRYLHKKYRSNPLN